MIFFSVVIPVYNKEKFLSRAIKSVLNQSFHDFEIIIVNDGSTDNSLQELEKYNSSKMTIISQKNKGVSVSRNTGIMKSSGKYIAFLDADDFWHSSYLQTYFDFLSKNEVGILGVKYVFDIDELAFQTSSFEEIKGYFLNAHSNWYYTTPAVVIRRDFFLSNKGFNPKLSRGEDLDVWFRAVCFYGKAYYSPSPLVYVDKGDKNSLTKRTFPINQSILSVIGRNDYYIFSGNSSSNIQKEFDLFRTRFFYLGLLTYIRKKEFIFSIKSLERVFFNRIFIISKLLLLPSVILVWLFSKNKFRIIYKRMVLKLAK